MPDMEEGYAASAKSLVAGVLPWAFLGEAEKKGGRGTSAPRRCTSGADESGRGFFLSWLRLNEYVKLEWKIGLSEGDICASF